MSDFSPFLRKRRSSGCSCDRSCLLHCTESLIQPHSRSSFRTLAHLSAFSLIFTRRFSIFLTKNAISVFLCHFMLIFQPAAGMHEINYGQFPLFEPLFRPQASSLALQRRFWELQRYFREISMDSRTLSHASDHSEKAPDEDKK